MKRWHEDYIYNNTVLINKNENNANKLNVLNRINSVEQKVQNNKHDTPLNTAFVQFVPSIICVIIIWNKKALVSSVSLHHSSLLLHNLIAYNLKLWSERSWESTKETGVHFEFINKKPIEIWCV